MEKNNTNKHQEEKQIMLKNLYEEAINNFMDDSQYWLDFLKLSVRVHKYSLDEQILLYIQNPDVKLAATYDTWKKLDRYVKKGAKALPLPDHQTGGFKHIFDISQTGGKDIKIFNWQLNEKDRENLTNYLTSTYSKVNDEQNFEKQINYFIYEKMKQANVEPSIAVKVFHCVNYITCNRIGVPTSSTEEQVKESIESDISMRNFLEIGYFTNHISREVLKEVEGVLENTFEKERVSYRERIENEGSLQRERRWDFVSRDQDDRGRDADAIGRDRVIDSSENGSEGTTGGPGNENEGNILHIRKEEGARSLGQNRESVSATSGEESSAKLRTTVGKSSSLQISKESGEGNDIERDELQLNKDSLQSDRETLSDFLVSNNIPLSAVDEILRTGSNRQNSILRICSLYKKDHSLDRNIAFLKNEYREGGKGIKIDDEKFATWFSKNGIKIARGNSALDTQRNVLVTWEQVDERMKELLHMGQYATKEELDKADANEVNELASKLWYLYRDTSIGVPEEWMEDGYSFPDNVKVISQRLTQGDTLTGIIQKLEGDIEDDVFSNRWTNAEIILQHVKDLQRTSLNFSADEGFYSYHEKFITRDEVNEFLKKGSSFSEGKYRIYSYFLQNHSLKEKETFLKNEYGTGGRTGALSGADNSYESHSPSGIELSRGSIGEPYDLVKLSWNEVVKKIDRLITEGKYMSEEETAYLPKYEKEALAKQIYSFFNNPNREEITKPYPPMISSEEAQKVIHSKLDDTEELSNMIGIMDQVYENLNEDDEQYFRKKEIYQNALSFQNGTFTLFPTNILLKNQSTKAFNEEQSQESDSIEQLSFFSSEEGAENDKSADIEEFPDSKNEQEMQKEDFRFPSIENFYETGQKKKYESNVEAIRLLKSLEKEERVATSEEQVVLAKYSGWGGLSEAFNARNPKRQKEYQELKELLTEDEYQNAFESVLSAYYTEPKLIKSIYNIVENLGMKEGEILDPAMGTGNFFAMLPENMQQSQLYGIELDSITGRIAKQLHPNATIAVKGYEEVDFDDNSFDLVIGNIPFNDITISDERYKNQQFLIHDYFVAKSIDSVKESGLVAFITSKGTMDKKDDRLRRYVAERADLVGGIRLPNSAFMKLGGTKATTDILVFQKREIKRDLSVDMPDWVKVVPFQDSRANVNQYFVDNQQHVLGNLELSGMYGGQSILECTPKENQDIYQEIEKITPNFQVKSPILSSNVEERNLEEKMGLTWEEGQEVPKTIRNNTYFVHENKVYFNEHGNGKEIIVNQSTEERLKAMCQVRQDLMNVINMQLEENYSMSDFENSLNNLNKSYDTFVEKFGHFNSKSNTRMLAEDDQLTLLQSIEVAEKDGSLSKGKIFIEPTIRPQEDILYVETASKALELSLSRKLKVDLSYMEDISPFSKDELIQELDGTIYQDPELLTEQEIDDSNKYDGWVYRDEYLSGDIRHKLDVVNEIAAKAPEDFSKNVVALENAMPEPLTASDIQFQIGSTWIPIKYYEDFMYETFSTPGHYRMGNNNIIRLEFLSYTNTWNVKGKHIDKGSLKASSVYGTKRMSAYEILENTLNLQQVTVRDREIYHRNGKEEVRYVINPQQTMIARGKQTQIKQAFASWLFKDNSRAEALVNIYNEKFNRIVPRKYDGSHLEFSNMNKEWELRKHQKDVVARVVYNGSALMAHEVGAGKTASMIAAGMYMKQAGVVEKPMYVVPSHLTNQFANEFLSIYPGANILRTTKKDFEKKNRQRFVSKIATNNYDAVIIGHSQFEKIPLSKEKQADFLRKEINNVTISMQKTKDEDKNSWTVKQMAGFQKRLQEQLKKLMSVEKKDNILDFEQLGVDFLFVDEAHIVKNLYTFTKLKNVAGVNTSQSQRAMDMYQKCLYIQENNNNRGVVFSTGTPIVRPDRVLCKVI